MDVKEVNTLSSGQGLFASYFYVETDVELYLC